MGKEVKLDWEDEAFRKKVDTVIQRALEEDIGPGDVTTDSIVPHGLGLTGQLIAKERGVVAGILVMKRVFELLDPEINFQILVKDASWVQSGDIVAIVEGNSRALLKGERVALNFLQRMSGIATLTHRFVEAVRHTHAKILDTRKTAPGLRLLDKWAVRLGGGMNHRFGLYDMVLIKENHIAAAGGITKAVNKVKQKIKDSMPIEVETKTLEEVKEAMALPIQRILLDNMDVVTIQKAVEMVCGKIPLEASGNISIENVVEVAETGVDYISVGKLTHSVKAVDFSFLLES
ncbi:MAG: carboxylating nicotinate-nucleotide diphosphorylase [Deltaproteobacteria bacterium]|nr:carboxylating nicotinate-nucleotide diphosphorylase [Deltaproteobacteria bacterium]MBW1931271.1 carboxylating nicotinate-nucleotide diphosphorylase [Deltaproteobacteria bacterium]MBW2026405.1 carboxylating nicotinate-nucleotide diphosphorylase [Deltaproteobacteria bacterium]MBW2126211.1 carboxylating nicotinate-nucleotide diphosphorylase [Deltaproteobacteria bacterium]